MKTSELIVMLASDRAPSGLSLRSRFWLALGLSVLISVGLFIATLGPRPDFAVAIHSPRFDLKFADTLALALPSALLCFRLMRPDARPGRLALLFAAPLLLLGGAVVAELLLVPSQMWGSKLVGVYSLHCLAMIPLLSIAPLFVMLFAMRGGAPQNPALTGGLTGSAAAGISAMFNAAHCPDDSPLFVASWYPLATMIVVAVGAFAGHRFLRW